VFRIRSHQGGSKSRHFVHCACSSEDDEFGDFNSKAPRLFDGFPYLNTRVVETMRHLIALPAGRGEEGLRTLAQEQARANGLETCLVLSADRAIFYTADGELTSEGEPPAGGLIVSGKLQPAEDFSNTRELAARRRRLEEFIKARRQIAYPVCKPRTSRREATAEERESLAGEEPGGIPRGLTACPACGQYRGLLLGGTHHEADGWVAEVYCRCQNHSRCARCLSVLYSKRLNGFYYERGKVLHVPGFMAFNHTCPPIAWRVQ
jgi:hypothetical protein